MSKDARRAKAARWAKAHRVKLPEWPVGKAFPQFKDAYEESKFLEKFSFARFWAAKDARRVKAVKAPKGVCCICALSPIYLALMCVECARAFDHQARREAMTWELLRWAAQRARWFEERRPGTCCYLDFPCGSRCPTWKA